MVVVVCSSSESALDSLVSVSSTSSWNLFCSSSWNSVSVLGSSNLVRFHFCFLWPFFSTLNFTLIFARTRECSDPKSTLLNDLVLSTADLHLSLIKIKSIMFFDLRSGEILVHFRKGLCLKCVLDITRPFLYKILAGVLLCLFSSVTQKKSNTR